MRRTAAEKLRPWATIASIVVFFAFAGLTVASTATALTDLARADRYSPATIASFFLVCGISLVLGVLFAVAGRGASRLLLGGAMLALGFGAVHSWSPSDLLTSVLAPIALTGFFWILASFPGVRPDPRWLRWVVIWLAAWSCVCFGIVPIREDIAAGVDPWSSLVGPGFLAGLAVIVIGKAVRLRHVEPGIRRWYLTLGVAVMLSLGGAGVLAGLTAMGHFAVGNGVDDASALFGNLTTASILVIVGAAAIKEGYYGVAVTDEQRRAAWGPEDPLPPPDLAGLTYRERQLLPLLARGAPTSAMARHLGVSEKTVRNYLSGLYAKLGAEDRATGALAARGALEQR